MDADEAILKMLAGAHFAPGSKVILPSGKVIDGAEAQAMTSFYAPATPGPDDERGVLISGLESIAATFRFASQNLDLAVAQARSDGLTWDEIANAIGLSHASTVARWRRS